MSGKRRTRMRTTTFAAAVLLAALVAAFARSQDDDDASPARLKAEIAALKREVKELRARVAALEARLAAPVTTSTAQRKPAVTNEEGFVFPNMPSLTGAASAGELARSVHGTATRGADLTPLLAYEKGSFVIPESLWSQAAKGLDVVVGLPARDELEIALAALRRCGEGSSLDGIVPLPAKGTIALAVLDLTCGSRGRPERFRLTAAQIGGRWFLAHLLWLSAEEEARAFLQDVADSQRAFLAFNSMKRCAKNLRELANARKDLEESENLRAAGLTFPLGARLDRLEKDQLAWADDALSGPLYTFKLEGVEGKGEGAKKTLSWSGTAMPRGASYRSFSFVVPPTANDAIKLDEPVKITSSRGSSNEK